MDTSPSFESARALLDKIKNVRICMFTTEDGSGQLASRPMTVQQIEDDGGIWFFTSDETAFARDLPSAPQTNLSFVDSSDSLYVSVTGHASQVRNKEKIKSLWNPLVAAWFPKGMDDPHVILVKVSSHSAEYWDSASNKMVQLFDMAKAALTGQTPKIKPGEHGRVSL